MSFLTTLSFLSAQLAPACYAYDAVRRSTVTDRAYLAQPLLVGVVSHNGPAPRLEKLGPRIQLDRLTDVDMTGDGRAFVEVSHQCLRPLATIGTEMMQRQLQVDPGWLPVHQEMSTRVTRLTSTNETVVEPRTDSVEFTSSTRRSPLVIIPTDVSFVLFSVPLRVGENFLTRQFAILHSRPHGVRAISRQSSEALNRPRVIGPNPIVAADELIVPLIPRPTLSRGDDETTSSPPPIPIVQEASPRCRVVSRWLWDGLWVPWLQSRSPPVFLRRLFL